MERVTFGVLGPVVAEGDSGVLALKGPRHRAVLARLLVARRRVVPIARLVEDLWDEPPAGAVGAVQTFVAALRRVLEPDRRPRTPARLLVTEGPGYALRAEPDAVDAWRFETATGSAASLPPAQALERLREGLGLWRGPAYAEFAEESWARGERSRLAELRLWAEEQRAEALLALGRAAEAVPDLEARLAGHPWREDAWRLLALALYRSGRQGDALAVLRRARAALADRLGVDPGPRLRRLEADVLAQDPGLDLPSGASASAARLWARAAEDYDRTVAAGARARLESTVGLIRNLAVTGGSGLEAAREHRMAAIRVAEESGDPELTSRVIGAFDVPAIWPRSDDPELARRIVAAAERTLAARTALAADDPRGRPAEPSGSLEPLESPYDPARCRLLATVAVESRGTRSPRGPRAAREAERIARGLDDPALLAFCLNGVFMQSCTRAGMAPRRDEVGGELVALAARHGLVTFEVLGHLIRLQARAALGDFPAADAHAAAADRLAAHHELPLVGVFTQWYGALRLAASGHLSRAEAACRAAAARLDTAGMPGVRDGLLPLALLCLSLADGTRSAREAAEAAKVAEGAETAKVAEAAEAAEGAEGAEAALDVGPGQEWGPYRPWAEPFALLRKGDTEAARAALRALPQPPADLLYEALCCLEAAVALELGDRPVLERVHARLLPAAGELAGAGSGMITLGPVDRWLDAVGAALGTGLP
ncbi:winged helix-turn-helix domain-containing protein [Streptomyces sp. NBC_01775]|uniref:AfsR/SARP family transcriptional regulator n=1 Tax=Streptomyces sp. NBC_01775 TaxID=2975939 RepID=UPI002DDADAC6|nr:BTAD domain-containing putative transcriptional regulator [Streptomyces sp. NBC_01775]WSB78125.1 winged helix-turn-helix domain-containing protein [Streptomyces sp. NBC_01775]